MSLIIAFNVRDGLVAAADRCTTRHNNGNTTHNFDSRKIVALNSHIVAVHCGDYFVDSKTTMQEFLESCRALLFPEIDIVYLPLMILSKYHELKYHSNNIIFISGFNNEAIGFIYKIDTSTSSVTQVYGNRIFGGVWDGVTYIASPILKSAACECISLLDAVELCKLAIEATGRSQYYCGVEVTVGDKADIFVIPRLGEGIWLSNNFELQLKGLQEGGA